MKQNISFLSILIFLIQFSCNKEIKKDNLNDEIELAEIEIVNPKSKDSIYLKNPNKADTLCLNDIKKAKNDLEKYKGVIPLSTSFGRIREPYYYQLKKIIDNKGFKLHIVDIGCVIYKNQTEECYNGYVDLVMKKKYGNNYYQEIIKHAKEKLIFNLVHNDSVIDLYNLQESERPKLNHPNSKYMDIDYTSPIKFTKPLKHDSKLPLYVNLNFIIEKNGEISTIKFHEITSNTDNQVYNNEVIEAAIKELKTNYNKWYPGEYEGNKIRTQSSLRVYFK